MSVVTARRPSWWWRCPLDPPGHWSVTSGLTETARAVRQHLALDHGYDRDLVDRTIVRHPLRSS